MSTTYYPLSDLLYRTEALTDSSGDIAEAYDTDAYGNTEVYSGPGTDGTWFTNDDITTFLPACETIFTGRQYDPETQIYFYRARYYQPQLGRFVSRDPVGYKMGINLFQYAGNNPIVRRDPDGTTWKVSRISSEYRADADGECGDTVKELADQIGLNANEFRAWLRSSNGSLPSNENEKLTKKAEFTVPNTAVLGMDIVSGVIGGWQLNDESAHQMLWADEGLALVPPAQFDYTLAGMLASFRRDDLYKFYFTGHGEEESGGLQGALDTSDGRFLRAGTYTAYGINELVLAACYTNTNAAIWASNVSKAGGLTTYKGIIGGLLQRHDSVYQHGTR